MSKLFGGGHGIIGSILGLSFGIWGAMVGFAAPKGRGRRLALVSGMVLEGITLALFSWGLLLMARGEPQTAWYSYILYGIIGGVVGIPLLVIVRRAYSASEMRMMQAQDASENLGEH